jgi:precorrin-2 methylase
MTPKEKAEELFNKMDTIIYTDQDSWKRQCVKCAIVVADEAQDAISYNMQDEEAYEKEFDFWEEVKKELQKI